MSWSFLLYLLGTLILITGLSYGATLAGVPDDWILAGALVVLGMGILRGVTRTRTD